MHSESAANLGIGDFRTLRYRCRNICERGVVHVPFGPTAIKRGPIVSIQGGSELESPRQIGVRDKEPAERHGVNCALIDCLGSWFITESAGSNQDTRKPWPKQSGSRSCTGSLRPNGLPFTLIAAGAGLD